MTTRPCNHENPYSKGMRCNQSFDHDGNHSYRDLPYWVEWRNTATEDILDGTKCVCCGISLGHYSAISYCDRCNLSLCLSDDGESVIH